MPERVDKLKVSDLGIKDKRKKISDAVREEIKDRYAAGQLEQGLVGEWLSSYYFPKNIRNIWKTEERKKFGLNTTTKTNIGKQLKI